MFSTVSFGRLDLPEIALNSDLLSTSKGLHCVPTLEVL